VKTSLHTARKTGTATRWLSPLSALLMRGIAALVLACSPARAAEPALNAKVGELIAAARLDGARVGVSVVDVKTGNVLCAIGEQRRMTPASNVKLITTSAALLLLGEKFQFTTSVYASGKARAGGVLEGDIVVVAGGDPAISGREHGGRTTAVFDAWAAEIARTITLVRGDLVIDATLFDRQFIHPSWPKDQLVRWYCAPVSAFALNDNCIDVKVGPGSRAGLAAKVTLDPPTAYFGVRNTCRTVASGRSRAYINRSPGRDTLLISGRLRPGRPGASSPVAVVLPVRFAATVLKERLARAGVRLGGKIVIAARKVDTAGLRRLAGSSHSLVSAVRTANKRSQNFYAEMILKTMGLRVSRPSSFASGVRVVAGQLEKMGIRQGTYTMADGSGLSRENTFSAAQLTTVLRHMGRSRHAARFIGSLAVAGVDGTLKRRMTEPATAGKVFGKTGHLRGVSVISGYVKPGGRLVAFSILINGAQLRASAAKSLQDSICRVLVDLRR